MTSLTQDRASASSLEHSPIVSRSVVYRALSRARRPGAT